MGLWGAVPSDRSGHLGPRDAVPSDCSGHRWAYGPSPFGPFRTPVGLWAKSLRTVPDTGGPMGPSPFGPFRTPRAYEAQSLRTVPDTAGLWGAVPSDRSGHRGPMRRRPLGPFRTPRAYEAQSLRTVPSLGGPSGCEFSPALHRLRPMAGDAPRHSRFCVAVASFC